MITVIQLLSYLEVSSRIISQSLLYINRFVVRFLSLTENITLPFKETNKNNAMYHKKSIIAHEAKDS